MDSASSMISQGNTGPTTWHNFEVHTYRSPHFCDFCGEFIWGLVRQGIKCSNCGMNVHKRCGQKVGNDCRPTGNRHSQSNAQAKPSLPASMSELSTLSTSTQQTDVPKVQPTVTEATVASDSVLSLPHTFDEINVSDQEFDKCDVCGGKQSAAARTAAAHSGASRLRLIKCRDCGFICHKTCQTKAIGSCKPVTPPPEPADMSPNGDDSSSDVSAPGTSDQASANDTQSPRNTKRRGRPPRGAVDVTEERQLPLMTISASIKRKHQKQAAQDAQRAGWMICYTSRDGPHQRAYWRLDTRAVVMHENEDIGSPITMEVPLDNVVAVEEAVPLSPTSQAAANSAMANPSFEDMPHVFTIRMPALIYYCGEDPTFFRRRPDRCDMQRGSGREYAAQWMKRIRELCTVLPSIGDTVNIRDLYDIHQDQVLGSGQFGVVYLATSRKDGRVVALKVIDAARIEKQKLLPEIRILKGINHPGIVSLIDFYDTAQKIYVCMERLDRDMLDLILNSPQSRLDERHTKFLVQQILTALKYLHTNHIVHCDLKPENVLLVAEHPYPQVKLCDFGFSRIIGERSFRQSVVGTPAYLAPEVLAPKPRFNKALDMWSVGVIVYVSLSGVFPYNASQDIVSQIRDASFLFPADPWSQISSSAVDLIRRLMDDRVRIRWACQQALKHDWFSKDYHAWCDLRGLETRLEAATGRSTRWWTDENDDELWDQLRAEKGLPSWQEIGCKSVSRKLMVQIANATRHDHHQTQQPQRQRRHHQRQPNQQANRNDIPVPMDIDDSASHSQPESYMWPA